MKGKPMQSLALEENAGVLHVILDRPDRRNAINLAMFDELRAVFEEVGTNPRVRVVVLRGSGGNFCSGGDLAPDDAPGDNSPIEERTRRILEERVAPMAKALHALPQPTIAVVEGVAAGAGANLALGCDFVLAAEGARFCEIFVRRALSLDCGGSWLLPRLVGLRKAKELAMLGDWIEAAEAADLGLINRVVAAPELAAEVDTWCERLVCHSPGALARIKRALDESFEFDFSSIVDGEAEDQAACTTSPDFAEAIAAFLEKRPARFGPR